MKKKKIFIIAGEKSGDLLGSKILKNLDKNEFEFYGVGGELMEGCGMKSIFPMTDLCVMGFFEILPKLFTLLKRIKQTVKAIIDIQPDILLTIDAPDFSFRIAKAVKKLDKENKIKKAHFVAPSVWAYRKNRAEKIAKSYDLLLCILPFEPEYFEKYGLKSVFVGHPIFYKESREYNFNENSYDKNSKNISITLGSRQSEVKALLPMIQNIVNRLNKNFDLNYYFLVTNNTYNLVQNSVGRQDNVFIVKNEEEKRNIIKNSLLAIAKSGTNTLEFSAFSIPIIIYYKFSFLTNFVAESVQKRNNIVHVNLLNIIENKEIIPEFILDKCKEEDIYNKIVEFLNDENLRLNQVNDVKMPLKKMGYNDEHFSSKLIINELLKLL